AVKTGRHVNIAIVVSQPAIGLGETKDVVPTVQPVVLKTLCSDRNRAQKIVNNLVRKLGVEDNKGVLPANQLRVPGSVKQAVVLVSANFDKCLGDLSYFLPLLRQSARNCA